MALGTKQEKNHAVKEEVVLNDAEGQGSSEDKLCMCVLLELWWPALRRAAVCQLSNKTRLQICSGKGREGLPAAGASARSAAFCQQRASALEALEVILEGA